MRYNRKIYSIGQRYNSFVIVKATKSIVIDKDKHYTRWECLCDCGNIFSITTKQINRGQKSCGCHKFKSRFRKKLSDEQANLRKVINYYKTGAKRRKISWKLTEEQATILLKGNCQYCNKEPNRVINYLKHCKSSLVSGIDRIDSNGDYSIDNCVSCCKICNRAKLDSSIQEFEEWAINFANNFKRLKHENSVDIGYSLRY
jgi:predicted  nucleic acid-binding Zn-ribbon protein